MDTKYLFIKDNTWVFRIRIPKEFQFYYENNKEYLKSTKAHKSQADRIAKLVKEKLSVEEEGVEEKKLTAAEKKKKEDIIMALKKQKGGKKNLEPVDYAVATDRAKKLAEKNEK